MVSGVLYVDIHVTVLLNDTKVSSSGNNTEIYQAQTGCPKWSIRAFCKFLVIFSLIIELKRPLFGPVFLHAESPGAEGPVSTDRIR